MTGGSLHPEAGIDQRPSLPVLGTLWASAWLFSFPSCAAWLFWSLVQLESVSPVWLLGSDQPLPRAGQAPGAPGEKAGGGSRAGPAGAMVIGPGGEPGAVLHHSGPLKWRRIKRDHRLEELVRRSAGAGRLDQRGSGPSSLPCRVRDTFSHPGLLLPISQGHPLPGAVSSASFPALFTGLRGQACAVVWRHLCALGWSFLPA